MNKKNKNLKDKKLNNKSDYKLDNITVGNKVIEQSLDEKVNTNIIDNSNVYYSERYGWTLKKN